MQRKIKLWGYGAVGLILMASVTARGKTLFASNEPVKVDPNSIYQTVPAPPGSSFRAVSCGTDSIIAQLAHSSDGIVRLPPGDYTVPVRMY